MAQKNGSGTTEEKVVESSDEVAAATPENGNNKGNERPERRETPAPEQIAFAASRNRVMPWDFFDHRSVEVPQDEATERRASAYKRRQNSGKTFAWAIRAGKADPETAVNLYCLGDVRDADSYAFGQIVSAVQQKTEGEVQECLLRRLMDRVEALKTYLEVVAPFSKIKVYPDQYGEYVAIFVIAMEVTGSTEQEVIDYLEGLKAAHLAAGNQRYFSVVNEIVTARMFATPRSAAA